MSNEFLADSLIDEVRLEGLLPQSDETSTASRIRSILNREQRLYLMTLLLKAREEYQTDFALVTKVSGTSRYRIPSRAVGAAIRRVLDVQSPADVPLYPISQDRLQSQGNLGSTTGEYYLDGNYLVLTSTPTSSGTLQIVYPRRFNRIVEADDAAEISAINTVTKAVTLTVPTTGSADVPEDFSSSETYDFIRGTPHFDILGTNEPATLAANVLTFTNALPAELAVGDFVALTGQTPISNAPLELQDVLIYKAAYAYLSSGGDANKAGMVEKRWQAAEANALSLISPRVKDAEGFLINFNAPGWTRGRFRRWGR